MMDFMINNNDLKPHWNEKIYVDFDEKTITILITYLIKPVYKMARTLTECELIHLRSDTDCFLNGIKMNLQDNILKDVDNRKITNKL